METYREKLKVSQRIYTVAAVLLIIFSILFLLSECGVVNISPVTGDSHWQSRWRGFVSGASIGIAGLMLVGIIRISKALKDEKALKKLYIQDHDERQIQIWTAARATAMQIFLIGGLVAAIIAGYFNMTVSITILACTLIQCLLGVGCKLYYSKKY